MAEDRLKQVSFKEWLSQGGRWSFIVAGLGFAASIAGGYCAHLLTPPPPEVVFARTNDLVSKYKGMVEAKASFQKETAAWAEEARQLQDKLQDLLKQGNPSDPKMREQVNELRSRIDSLKERGARRDQELTAPVLAEINAGVKKYAEKHHYRVVLGTMQGGIILHGDDAIDITDALLAELNK